ncbi:cysteine desulfurase [Quadrisphaera granulorum]|uniref:Cysteine desulfurase n=1 Tax=Quadrisphaera granulorum TaxID=317664 RepID=A0A316A037_9ACTN|nr:cysteine desulfurase family protein [Quadrisphaera granulorum]PWJ51201.1 cysteine desulfurase [Quadrisphaera granulorum]SZE97851.1 cysteine desulfurase [Quadrisphaera granulorum]
MHYLDHAATSPPTRQVLEAVWPYLVQVTANPASVHTPGQQAREGLDRARATAAEALGCRAGEVVFTSGGTESDGLAVLGIAPAVVAARGRERHLVTTAVEHAAVLEPARALERQGWRVDVVGVDGEGRVDVSALADVVTERTALVSVMHANNEVGTVQPLAGPSGVAQLCAERGVALHVDAVQSAGVLDLRELWALAGGAVSAVSVSAHKLGGLRGSGLLAVRSGTPLEPVALGGGQERGRRSGTVDVASAVGLATALSAAAARREHEVVRLAALRDRLVAGVLEIGAAAGVAAALTGAPPGAGRLPGHASFVLPGLSGEVVLAELDLAGVACSSGSACSADSDDASHVLLAMGLAEDAARTSVRATLGWSSTDADVDALLDALPTALARAGR